MPTLLQLHVERWENGCGSELCPKARKVCLAGGRVPCDVLFVGEAPGTSENLLGVPFVGPAGHLLDLIISKSVTPMGMTAGKTNIVGCIPYDEDGRKVGKPPWEAVLTCRDRLVQFVGLADPRLIVAVGAEARGALEQGYRHSPEFHKVIPQVFIKHPAAILRESVAQKSFSIQQCVVTVLTAVRGLLV